ncbi:AAA family ATPase [Chromobacterium sp. S0633]|uniref:AAA family ATPase n=1 Tax=Chromobacterium sp. S0633 TaxID=2957805 RepID=UPI00209DCEA4|nr:AAA family ATPase [Chromobacterium sp. S0633]
MSRPADSRRLVLTGGPGAGKTALLEALRDAGFSVMDEAGRAVIQDQALIGGRALPWVDPGAFAEAMLAWELRSLRLAEGLPGPVFFDRGLPDVLGYLDLQGLPIPAHMQAAAERFPYHRQVFLLPPWREIFIQDQERKQGFAEAERTCAAMERTYRRLAYQIIEVPPAPLAQRLRFVIEQSRLGHGERAGQFKAS